MKWFTLKRRFDAEATSKAEAKELWDLAQQIEALDLPTLDKATKARIASDIGFGYHPYRKTFARSWEGAMAVLVIMVLVFAQSAKPGSALYAVKSGTDKVRTVVTQNVPLLDRFDDSPQHEDNHNAGTDDNKDKGTNSVPSDSSHGSGSNDPGTSGGGTGDSSGQGSSGSDSTSSGLSSGDGSSGDGTNSNSGKDSNIPINY